MVHIEEYYFGYVVCNKRGIALSQAFKTMHDAHKFINDNGYELDLKRK